MTAKELVILTALATLSMAPFVVSASGGYVCTISTYSVVTKDGRLDYRLNDPMVGQEFTVDKDSGKVIGKYLSSDWLETKVLQLGTETMAFKMFGRSPGRASRAMLLQIDEFAQTPLKPFLLMYDAVVYSGQCR